VILAVPLGYLLLHQSETETVTAGAAQTAVPGSVNLAALEAAAKSDPSAANQLNLSMGYINAGQAGRAIPLLEALTAKDPGNAAAWNNLCVANTMQQSYGEGISDCNRALAILPDFPLAKNNLKWATAERDATIRAISVEEQTDNSKRDAPFYLAEGMNFLHVGNYDEATHAWHRALEMDPHSAAAANNIGMAAMLKKQPAEAIPWFQRAIELDPTMQLAKNNLAWAESVNH
jgi:tetratricopeptide (TPR) repeat protein